jgi:hypothetical protein
MSSSPAAAAAAAAGPHNRTGAGQSRAGHSQRGQIYNFSILFRNIIYQAVLLCTVMA